jgi:SusD family.
MKKYIIPVFILLLVAAACDKSKLELSDPNLPTPEQSLSTEAGLKSFALGILQKMVAFVPDEGNTNIFQIALTNHTILGDEAFVPYGNWGLRWVNQVYSVTLPSGQVVINPNGVDQKTQLQGFDSRDAGERNAFQYEWSSCYYIIAQSNQLFKSLENADISFSGDADTKRATLKAWAQWWKGYAYSRIGSMYLAGVITDEAGVTNDNFVHRTAIIAEADKVLNDCLTTLATINPGADYDDVMTAIVATFNDNANIVSPDSWKRQIYSLQARNLLVNKKVKDMTAADWTQIQALTDKGIRATDNIFKFGMDPTGTNDISSSFYHPYAFIGEAAQYTFVSERLIQDFKPGDLRLSKGFTEFSVPKVNIRGRGLQFGTRWNPVYIENGGLYATAANQGLVPWATSYEETELMTAEALIRTNNINEGLQHVDRVRDFQGSGLAHVSGTGLTQAQALEELRRERRVGLFLKGTAFYDARRWGVTEPASGGGGRAGAIVVVPGDMLVPAQANPQAVPCFMEYRYLDYWDVPQNEIDFNAPGSNSPPVKN